MRDFIVYERERCENCEGGELQVHTFTPIAGRDITEKSGWMESGCTHCDGNGSVLTPVSLVTALTTLGLSTTASETPETPQPEPTTNMEQQP